MWCSVGRVEFLRRAELANIVCIIVISCSLRVKTIEFHWNFIGISLHHWNFIGISMNLKKFQ